MTVNRMILTIWLVSTLAVSWGTDGHRITGIIAGNYVDKVTEGYMYELGLLGGSDLPRSLAYHSIWADLVQSDRSYAWASSLHFVFTEDGVCSPYSNVRDCDDGRCIVTAIANYTLRASDVTLSTAERAEAVRFLIHFMADIHQPLHVGFRRDTGGTKLKLTSPSTTLHNVWDVNLLEHYISTMASKNKHRQWNYYAVAQDLVAKIDEAGAVGTLVSENDAKSFDKMQAVAARVASETASKVTCPFGYQHEKGLGWIRPYDSLSKEWFTSRIPVMMNQLTKAGLRLAQLLDVIAENYRVAKSMNQLILKSEIIHPMITETKKILTKADKLKQSRFYISSSDESGSSDDSGNSSDEENANLTKDQRSETTGGHNKSMKDDDLTEKEFDELMNKLKIIV